MGWLRNEENEALHKLFISGTLLLAMFFLGVFGYFFIGIYTQNHEEWSILDCAYMTAITISTVGYGEVINVPNSAIFKLFNIVVIIFGMGTTVFFTSTVTAFIVEGNLQHIMGRRKMRKRIDAMKDHVIVCGAGETGIHIINELLSISTPVVAIDINEERLEFIYHKNQDKVPYIVGNAADDEVLVEAGIERAKGLIAACTEDKDNLFIIISARQLNPNLKIVTKAVAKNSESKLRNAGADNVVTGTYISGMRMASEMVRPTVVTFLDKMLRSSGSTMRVEEVPIPKGSPYDGKTIMEMDIRRQVGLAVMAIYDPKTNRYDYNPEAGYRLTAGMVLICLGDIDAVHKLRKIVAGKN